MTTTYFQGKYSRNEVKLIVWVRVELHPCHEKGGKHVA